MEVQSAMCATCPFRPDSPYASLAYALAKSALSEASRICHSTGTNIIGKRTGKKQKLCRGARNQQLHMFKALGFIEAASDEAWDKKRQEMGI